MFSIGGFELLTILILGIIILKPKDLPIIAEKIGKLVRRVRNAINSIKRDLDG